MAKEITQKDLLKMMVLFKKDFISAKKDLIKLSESNNVLWDIFYKLKKQLKEDELESFISIFYSDSIAEHFEKEIEKTEIEKFALEDGEYDYYWTMPVLEIEYHEKEKLAPFKASLMEVIKLNEHKGYYVKKSASGSKVSSALVGLTNKRLEIFTGLIGFKEDDLTELIKSNKRIVVKVSPHDCYEVDVAGIYGETFKIDKTGNLIENLNNGASEFMKTVHSPK